MRRESSILAIAAVVLLASCKHEAAPAPAAAVSASLDADRGRAIELDPKLVEAGRIHTALAERRGLDGELLLAGDAIPSAEGEADVGALVTGRVATIDVAEGDHVKKGQVLARIDAPEVGRATADLLRARGRTFVAARKLARQLDLEKQTATSQAAVDEARAEDQAARADLSAARTLLATMGAGEPASEEGATRGLAVRVAIRAPIDGIVVQRTAVLGGPVVLDRSLFKLISPEHLLVRARLPETAAVPPVGASATLRPRAPGGQAAAQRCDAELVSAFGAIDEATRTVPIRLRPKAPCAWLLPGAYVDVSIRIDGAGAREGVAAIVVPVESVVDVRGVPTVFIAGDRPGSFVARSVRVGRIAGTQAQIDAGLAGGERVVTDGAILLKGEMLRASLEAN